MVFIEPIIVLTALGGIILMLLIVGAPIRPIRLLGNLAVKFVVGGLLLFFVNAFGSFINFHIPINGITAAVSGLLGLPGVVLLVLVKQFIL